MKAAGKAYQDEKTGEWWEIHGTWFVNPAWLELQAESYPRRAELINSSEHRISDCLLNNDTRVIDGKIACRIMPLSVTLSAFDSFNLEDAESFHCLGARIGREFISACKEFEASPCRPTWELYKRHFVDMVAMIEMHYFWQTFVNIRATEAAHTAQVVPYLDKLDA